MINLDDENILLVGGYLDPIGSVGPQYTRETWVYNLYSTTWTLSEKVLATGRGAAACGKIQDSSSPGQAPGASYYLVVAGGSSSPSTRTKTTEIMSLTIGPELFWDAHSEWKQGPDFCYKASAFGSATSSDGKRLFVAGGRDDDNEPLAHIFLFQCWRGAACQWTMLEQSLDLARAFPVAIILPDNDIHVSCD